MLKPIILTLAIIQPLQAPTKLKEPYTFKNLFTQEDLVKQQSEKVLKIMFREMVKDANKKR
jgi:hypothetical protein